MGSNSAAPGWRERHHNKGEAMTLEQFEEQLKELFRKAEDSGLKKDDFCEIAEYVIANGWQPSVEGK